MKKICIRSLILFLCFGSGCSQSVKKESGEKDIISFYTSGLDKLAQDDSKGAEVDFRKIFDIRKKSPYGYTGLALVALKGMEYRKALRLIRKAVKADDGFVDAYTARGRILSARNKRHWFKQAAVSFEHALGLDPGNEKALYYFGECYLKNLSFELAESCYKTVSEKQGPLKKYADEKHKLLLQILETNPLSPEGKRSALALTVNRSELSVLLTGELQIMKKLHRHNRQLFESVFRENLKIRKDKRVNASDVSSDKNRAWIEYLMPLNIPGITAYPDGRFYPEKTITRAQLAETIYGIVYLMKVESVRAVYVKRETRDVEDVHKDYYAYDAIIFCVENGLMKTVALNEFLPNENVSGIDAVTAIRHLHSMLEQRSPTP
ncbi:S-layer homology domain-containing protein [Candidatus Omnitrophota bacterium]